MARSSAPTLLLLASAGLGYANWVIAHENIETAPILPAIHQGSDVAPDATPATARAALQDLQQTTARPLFSMDRRPVVAVAAAEPPKPPLTAEAPEANAAAVPPSASMPEVKLLGTLRYGGKKTRALILVQDAPEAGWVDLGGELAGWRLSEVQNDYVVLEASGTQRKLLLYPQKLPSGLP